jgi:hypothetical protein
MDIHNGFNASHQAGDTSIGNASNFDFAALGQNNNALHQQGFAFDTTTGTQGSQFAGQGMQQGMTMGHSSVPVVGTTEHGAQSAEPLGIHVHGSCLNLFCHRVYPLTL